MTEPEKSSKGASRIESRKAPRWTVAFLRGLERSGQARAAAADAGVDHTTAYARRRAHQAFAAEWADALEAHAAGKARADAAEVGCFGPAKGGGAEHVIVGGQLKRVGPGRWSKAKEQAFLAELAWSGNVRRACEAVGLSTAALSRRRLKDAYLAAAWNAAVEVARTRLNGLVVEAGNRTFDPD